MAAALPGTAFSEKVLGAEPLAAQAAALRGAGELGKNGMQGMSQSFNADLGLSEDMHTAAYMLAYNLAKEGKSESEILKEVIVSCIF